MDIDSRAEHSPPPLDFNKIARKFITSERGEGKFSDRYVDEIATGLKATDARLKSSKGEPILILYRNEGRIVYGAGRTDGEGIKITKDPGTEKDQITFGTDAVLQETIIGDADDQTEQTLKRSQALVIPEGFPLEVFTPSGRFRDFQIGNDEIIKFIYLSRIGVAQNAWMAFMLEQVGIDTNAYINDYFYKAFENPTGGRSKFEFDMHNAVRGYRETYGTLSEPSVATEIEAPAEVDGTVNVQPITIREGRVLVEDNGSYEDLGGKLNPEVTPVELTVNYIIQASQQGHTPFYLSWRGGRVPEEVIINGIEIGHMQHGVIYDIKGEMIGTYQRLSEFSGEDNYRHEMVAFMNRSSSLR